MKQFSQAIGLEDNDKYPKFKDGKQLVINCSTSNYFIIRFVAK